MKRLSADDSAATSVKVGHRQAPYKKPPPLDRGGGFALCGRKAGKEQELSKDQVKNKKTKTKTKQTRLPPG
ncbi:hypothetical protein, partial [Undibacterium luofuense]